jgi:hypothetical protein
MGLLLVLKKLQKDLVSKKQKPAGHWWLIPVI